MLLYFTVSDDSYRRYAVTITLQYASCADPHEVLEVYGIEKLRSAFISAIQCDKPEIASSAIRAASSILLWYDQFLSMKVKELDILLV